MANSSELALAATMIATAADGEPPTPTVLSLPTRQPPAGVHPPGTQLGRFTILEHLGAGAMGIVLAAYDPDLDRRIALKVLQPGASSGSVAYDAARTRLLREARAMASLTHRNVIAVHEVGVVGESAFIAMELAAGGTLRTWLRASPRKWPEILDRFMAAGHGLAAAHEAGLVHRDFKPENVLLMRDGTVKVADFGIAGTSIRDQAAGSSDGPIDESSRLTRAGTILGTPAYMAPEQHRGERVQAAADQFAFCVALWEALYGVRPYPGATYDALVDAVSRGIIAPPPAGTLLPAWLTDALRRGLRPEVAQRWPSMQALLAALGRDPARKRRPHLLTGTLAAAAVTISITATTMARGEVESSPPCPRADSRLLGVWDAQARERVRDALLATGRSTAAATFERVAARLDAYASRWVDARRDACLATQVRGEQSPALLDLRMACFDRRLGELRALATVLGQGPDDGALDRASEAAAKLVTLDSCDGAMLAQSSLPALPAERQRLSHVQDQLAMVKALEDAGRFADAVPLAVEVLATARELDHPSTHAEALLQLARLKDRVGATGEAEELLLEAITRAAEAKEDGLVATTWGTLLYVVGYRAQRLDDALKLRPFAEAAVARIGAHTQPGATIQNALGHLWAERGDNEVARRNFTFAYETRRQLLGEEHPDTAISLNGLGLAHLALGEHLQARERLEMAIQTWSTVRGPEHPTLVLMKNNLAMVLLSQGRYSDARALAERALAGAESTLGPTHPNLGYLFNTLGEAALKMGDLRAARVRYQRAYELRVATLGADHPQLALSLVGLGEVALAEGNPTDAERLFEQALVLRERAVGVDHPDLAAARIGLARVAIARGQLTDAAARLAHVTATQAKALGDDHQDLALTLVTVGELELRRGRPQLARTALERALTIQERSLSSEHPARAMTLSQLARVDLLERSFERARERAERALEISLRASASLLDLKDVETTLACARVLAAKQSDPKCQALVTPR